MRLALVLLLASACVTPRYQPDAPVEGGTTRAEVLATHGPPEFRSAERRADHEVETLVYPGIAVHSVVCLVDGRAVHFERTHLLPEHACYAYPQVARR